jgi:beta-lactamase superfamily II metal-dependent hydrolase
MSASVMIFDVGSGQCVALRTPNNHLVLIDCGCSDSHSPVLELARIGRLWTGRNGYALTQLIVSHPHTDHIADIERITRFLPPSMILRRIDLDWARVAGSSPSAALRHYTGNYLPPEYTAPIPAGTQPDWGDGFTLQSFWLENARARTASSSDNSYVNNTSIVSIAKYKGYTFAFTGDMETDGMGALLSADLGLCLAIMKTSDLFNQPAGGVDFYIAPHHGHPSGFSTNWFNITGPTRILNIVSERRLALGEDPSRARVDSRYSDLAYSFGRNREGRRMVSTRADGNISITINDDGTWTWQAVRT